MKKLFTLLLLIPSLSYGDHYKTGIIFADPNYQGCIWVYDLIKDKNKCVERSPKFYFNESKHPGSMSKAERQCKSYLRSEYSNVKKRYKGDLFEIDYYCQHD